VGRLRQNRWTNTSGDNCTRIVIVAEHIEFRSLPQDNSPELELETPEQEVETAEVEGCLA
jgi:single-strand DNA-binding protein